MCSTTTISSIHSEIIQSHILNRLDGQTLASTTCASAQFNSLCADDILWTKICNSTWPATTHPTVRHAIAAFPSGHRSFYSDSFPSVRRRTLALNPKAPQTSEFISAVDIFDGDKLLYSKVTATETLSDWFLYSPFRIDLLSHKETVATPLMFDDDACTELARERFRVSWILIDPSGKRAVNIASARAVEARRDWLTRDVQLRYVTVVGDDEGDGEVFQCAVVVNCGGKEGGILQVIEVGMRVEDIEGKIVAGKSSLGIIQSFMEGQRCKSEEDIYEMFLEMKVRNSERKMRRLKRMDMAASIAAAGVTIFFTIWTFFMWRR